MSPWPRLAGTVPHLTSYAVTTGACRGERWMMVLANANTCDFGWKARDFALKGVDGKTYSLTDVRGPKGTLVAFICNHCPYVRAVIGRLVEEAKALPSIGI